MCTGADGLTYPQHHGWLFPRYSRPRSTGGEAKSRSVPGRWPMFLQLLLQVCYLSEMTRCRSLKGDGRSSQ